MAAVKLAGSMASAISSIVVSSSRGLVELFLYALAILLVNGVIVAAMLAGKRSLNLASTRS